MLQRSLNGHLLVPSTAAVFLVHDLSVEEAVASKKALSCDRGRAVEMMW